MLVPLEKPSRHISFGSPLQEAYKELTRAKELCKKAKDEVAESGKSAFKVYQILNKITDKYGAEFFSYARKAGNISDTGKDSQYSLVDYLDELSELDKILKAVEQAIKQKEGN